MILIFSLFFYTFITMVGGNPENDAYGFRYFGGGRAFSPLYGTGQLAKFQGFLAALWQAAFTVVGTYSPADASSLCRLLRLLLTLQNCPKHSQID